MSDNDLLKYFMEKTDQRFDSIEKRFDSTDDKLAKIFRFEWMLLGGASVISALIGISIAILFGR